MIELDDAVQDLRVLASPTMAAFHEARQQYNRYIVGTRAAREVTPAAIAGLMDGVSYWAYFAPALVRQYGEIGVPRVAGTHPFTHQWEISSGVRLHLKSDTGNLPLDQMVFPGMPKTAVLNGEQVILTWSHTHEERHDPMFVHLEGRNEAWRMPVIALMPQVTDRLIASPPRSTMNSNRATQPAKPDDVASGND